MISLSLHVTDFSLLKPDHFPRDGKIHIRRNVTLRFYDAHQHAVEVKLTSHRV
jgi:hypothetical protein